MSLEENHEGLYDKKAMDATTLFILRLTFGILGAVLLFVLTGFTYVKKNQFVFVSKKGKLKTIWDEGWHYSFPWRYKLSKSYKKGPFSIRWTMPDGKMLTAYLIIRDPKKLFNAKRSLKKILKTSVKSSPKNTEIRKKVENAYKKVGVELINLVVTKRN